MKNSINDYLKMSLDFLIILITIIKSFLKMKSFIAITADKGMKIIAAINVAVIDTYKDVNTISI